VVIFSSSHCFGSADAWGTRFVSRVAWHLILAARAVQAVKRALFVPAPEGILLSEQTFCSDTNIAEIASFFKGTLRAHRHVSARDFQRPMTEAAEWPGR